MSIGLFVLFENDKWMFLFKLVQLVVGGILRQLKTIFGTQLEQCVNSFARQISEYDHDYQRYPPSPEFHMKTRKLINLVI